MRLISSTVNYAIKWWFQLCCCQEFLTLRVWNVWVHLKGLASWLKLGSLTHISLSPSLLQVCGLKQTYTQWHTYTTHSNTYTHHMLKHIHTPTFVNIYFKAKQIQANKKHKNLSSQYLALIPLSPLPISLQLSWPTTKRKLVHWVLRGLTV